MPLDTKLFVGNLSIATTEEELGKLFAQSGSVAAVELITVQNVGTPKTFAFIEMGSKLEAEKAVHLLNGREVKGRTIKVNIAQPREKRPEGRSWYTDPPPPASRNANSPRRSS